MAFRRFELSGIGAVTIYKRRGAKSMRLIVTANGTIKLTTPPWVPYAAALSYAQSKSDWLQHQTRTSSQVPLRDGHPIGKQHQLRFLVSGQRKATVKIQGTDIVVTYPATLHIESTDVQAAAERGAVRALRREAESVLPGRLRQLAATHDFHFASVTVKQLRGRWGSCDQRRHIVINLYVMQLPWELIDYVLLHELTHTQHLDHSAAFWRRFTQSLPDAKHLRKRMRAYKPNVRVAHQDNTMA